MQVLLFFSPSKMFAVQLHHICSSRCRAAFTKSLKHTFLRPSTCASTHVLTSHQCIIIPKQTTINEPCDAYLSERRQPPPPLPLGWGCHSDRFIDIWRERRRGVGFKGWGWRRRRGWVLVWGHWRSVFQMSLCVSSVNQPSVSVWAQWRNSSWTFLNQAAVRRHLGWARGLIPVMA